MSGNAVKTVPSRRRGGVSAAVVGAEQCRWESDSAGMAPEDLAALQRAVESLEHPGLAARLANLAGKPTQPPRPPPPPSPLDAIAQATARGLAPAPGAA